MHYPNQPQQMQRNMGNMTMGPMDIEVKILINFHTYLCFVALTLYLVLSYPQLKLSADESRSQNEEGNKCNLCVIK